MLYTFRVDYRPGSQGRGRAEGRGQSDRGGSGARDHRRGAEAGEGELQIVVSREPRERQSGFGRADLLAALALYDDDPNRINTILADLEKVTTAEVQAAAKKYLVPSNRTSIDRRPEGGAK